SASASGWRTPARRKRSSSVAATSVGGMPSPKIMDKASRLQILLPPCLRQIAEKRRSRGMLDSHPVRYPLHRWKVKRHNIKTGQQDAIECAGRSHEIGATGRRKHGRDHRVDRFRFDPHVVAAALLIGGRRAPVE